MKFYQIFTIYFKFEKSLNLVQVSSTHDILLYFITSIVSSIAECIVTCVVGGSTVTAVWHLAKGIGLEAKSISFYIFLILVSIPTIWIALFWLKILFIPSSRGKLSIFSPFLHLFLYVLSLVCLFASNNRAFQFFLFLYF